MTDTPTPCCGAAWRAAYLGWRCWVCERWYAHCEEHDDA